MSLPLVDLGALLALDPAATPELTSVLAPSDVPLALLPVRLETRFAGAADGSAELLIRVYPDKIHLDAHDPRLSAVEAEAGRTYWQAEWRCGTDESRLRAAWRVLTDRFGPGRAAWIARRLAPTNAGARPDQAVVAAEPLTVEPVLPDPGPPAERTATPVARLLPGRWTACAYARGALAATTTGADIRPDLPVGPDLDAPLRPGQDGPAVDVGMAWMIDFDEAERAGMGLRLRLTETTVADALIDLLIVSGVRAGDPDGGAAAYADLLAAQRFTDGIAFLAPGTPSNNSIEERAGFVSRDLRGELSFSLEWRAATPTAGSNAGRTERALGLRDAGLEHLAGAPDDHDRWSAAVQRALWPGTWGYYLTQFIGIGPGRLSLDDLTWISDFGARALRPGGPLPAVRVGRQPYGVLPVTTLGTFAAAGVDADRIARLRDLLAGLREVVWRPALADVARVGRSPDPNADLIDVLRTDAAGGGLAVRRAMGPQYVQHLRRFLGEDLEALGFWARLQQITSGLPGRVGLGFTPASGGLIWEPSARPAALPLVPADPPAMIVALLADDLGALSARVPASMMEAVLRQSLLREHALAAAQLLADQDRPVGELLRDVELVDLGPDPGPTPGFEWQLDQPVPGSSPPETVRARLAAAPAGHLTEFRAALTELAAAGPAVGPALRDGLGVTSHRLDAWTTAYATTRLTELRAARPTGLRTGGYGWLENLRPEPRTPIDPLPDEPGPLTAAVDDPGFVHAPSLGQAGAAALMRNAHLAHGATPTGAYAVNLTSERVRRAMGLFDGVRQGQSLGALLGYDVERGVHESGLDHLLDDLRQIAPPPQVSGGEAVERRVLLDGLELHRRWTDERTGLFGEIDSMSDRDRARLTLILDGLDAAIDAAGDAVTAENVFQFARGNLARSGGSLDEIATGKAPPPSLEFIRTPRTGTAITHRVLVAVEIGTRRSAGWATATPRAEAEPALDAWLSRLLGPATGVDVLVEVIGADGAVTARHAVPVVDLGLAALDLTWIAGDAAAATELARRAYAVAVPDGGAPPRSAHAGGGAEPALRLDLASGDDRSRRSLADLLEVAGRTRALLAGARPLDGADLQPAHAAPDRRLDLEEFEGRAAAGVAALADLHDQLTALLTADPPPQLGAVRAVLARLAGFGVTGALTPLAGPDQDRLVVGSAAVPAVAAVLNEAARRLTEAATLGPEPVEGPDEGRRDRILRRFRAIFGAGFLACPRFGAPTAAELGESRADPALLAEDRLAPHTWFQRMERIRPALARLGLALREAEILGSGVGLDLAAGQVPHVAGRGWLGMQFTPEAEGQGQDGQVSLVLAGSAGVDLGRPLAGLLVDEWTELVPSRTETTGIAFRFDPPDAVAPHAILLAVPPIVGEPWTIGTLNQVLLETLDLARLRTVPPDLLEAAGQFLPASLLSFNVAGDVPSTDPNVLIG